MRSQVWRPIRPGYSGRPLSLPALYALLAGVVLMALGFSWGYPDVVLHEHLVSMPRPAPAWTPGDIFDEGPGRLAVSLEADGNLMMAVGEDAMNVTRLDLGMRLGAQLGARLDKGVCVNVSPERDYREAVELIDIVRGAGARVEVCSVTRR